MGYKVDKMTKNEKLFNEVFSVESKWACCQTQKGCDKILTDWAMMPNHKLIRSYNMESVGMGWVVDGEIVCKWYIVEK